jgi:DNA-binding NarL/FixJ family response regulator
MRGDQLAMGLKKLRGSQSIAIIFHSAEEEPVLMELVIRTGARGYIPKGLGPTAFIERFDQLVAARTHAPRSGALPRVSSSPPTGERASPRSSPAASVPASAPTSGPPARHRSR